MNKVLPRYVLADHNGQPVEIYTDPIKMLDDWHTFYAGSDHKATLHEIGLDISAELNRIFWEGKSR